MKKTEEKQTQRKKKGGSACARSNFFSRSPLSAHVRSFGRQFVQSELVFDVARRFFTFHLPCSAAIALRVRHFDFVAEITESVSISERKCNG